VHEDEEEDEEEEVEEEEGRGTTGSGRHRRSMLRLMSGCLLSLEHVLLTSMGSQSYLPSRVAGTRQGCYARPNRGEVRTLTIISFHNFSSLFSRTIFGFHCAAPSCGRKATKCTRTRASLDALLESIGLGL
jgi:hypothetical protein